MEKRTQSLGLPLWQPFSLLFLGLFLIVNPGTFGFADSHLGCSDRICGALLVALGVLLRKPKSWMLLLTALLGVWLQFAPLLFRIAAPVGYLNDTLIGVLILFFSFILCAPKKNKGIDIPKGWSYNPSAFSQRLPVVILTGICWFLSRYLAAYQLGFIDTMWDPFFADGTIRVITSDVSKALPVPDAGLGAFAYTLEFLLGLHGGSARWRTDPWLVLSFGLLVVPVGLVSIFLIMLQPLVVHAWCTICLITAFAMLLMIMFTLDEVAAALQLLKRGHKLKIPPLKLLISGAPATDADLRDPRDVSLNGPLKKIFSVMFLGCGMPLNLLAAALIGALFMMLPSLSNFSGPLADADHILGALLIVASVVSMAEIVRKIRYCLCLFAPLIALIALFSSSGYPLFLHILLALLATILAFRKGPLKESYQ